MNKLATFGMLVVAGIVGRLITSAAYTPPSPDYQKQAQKYIDTQATTCSDAFKGVFGSSVIKGSGGMAKSVTWVNCNPTIYISGKPLMLEKTDFDSAEVCNIFDRVPMIQSVSYASKNTVTVVKGDCRK